MKRRINLIQNEVLLLLIEIKYIFPVTGRARAGEGVRRRGVVGAEDVEVVRAGLAGDGGLEARVRGVGDGRGFVVVSHRCEDVVGLFVEEAVAEDDGVVARLCWVDEVGHCGGGGAQCAALDR